MLNLLLLSISNPVLLFAGICTLYLPSASLLNYLSDVQDRRREAATQAVRDSFNAEMRDSYLSW